MTIRVVLKDRYYIPIEAVDAASVRRELSVPLETKDACRPDCRLARKPGRFCSTCPSLEATLDLWEVVRTPAGRKLVAVPAGDPSILQKILKDRVAVEVDDRRARVWSSDRLRWTGKLHHGQVVDGKRKADQRGMLSAWRKHVSKGATAGIVVSPPRTGKCVVGGTVIRTAFGYHPIEDLFSCNSLDVDRDIEIIGSFGSIVTPRGTHGIRGMYSKRVDEVCVVVTSLGACVGGTPNHPIEVVRNSVFTWVPLADIAIGDAVVLPRIQNDPTGAGMGLSEDLAALLGIAVAAGDRAQLLAGVLDVRTSDLEDAERFTALVHRVMRIDAPEHLVVHLAAEQPFLAFWREMLLASSDAAWLAFFRAHAAESTVFETSDRTLARAAHAQLLGMGVRSVQRRSHDRRYAVSLPLEDLAVAANSSAPLLDPVISISRRAEPTRVYDVMVPETRSFVANGISNHNTVIGVAGTLAQRQRTIITASKIDFLRQFGRRFGELTNLRRLYDAGHRPVVLVDQRGWPEGPDYGVHVVRKWTPDIHRADVVITPYQQLLNTERGRDRMRKFVVGKFGMLVADEMHQSGADGLARMINRTDARYKLGLTATPKRKDKRMMVAHAVLGEIAAQGKIASDLPRCVLMETGVASNRNFKSFNSIIKFVTEHSERNKIIVRQIFKDLRENPGNCVLVPTMRINQINEIIKMVNAQADYCRRYKGENWPSELAVAYIGKSDTNAILNQIAAGNARVVVATVTMVQYGLDVARWTHVYVGITPMSNPYMMYQLCNRVCTPYTDEMIKKLGKKPNSIVRFVIDMVGASVFCFAKLFNDKDYGIMAGIRGDNFLEIKLYRAEQRDLDRMGQIATNPRSYSAGDVGVKTVLGRDRRGRKHRKATWVAARPVVRF